LILPAKAVAIPMERAAPGSKALSEVSPKLVHAVSPIRKAAPNFASLIGLKPPFFFGKARSVLLAAGSCGLVSYAAGGNLISTFV
jgi:hypothetical protein